MWKYEQVDFLVLERLWRAALALVLRGGRGVDETRLRDISLISLHGQIIVSLRVLLR